VSDAIWRPTPEAMSPRWWGKFERQPDGCLLWTGAVDKAGYGRSKGYGPAAGEVYIHRIVYLLLVGPIPDDPELDLDIDHECHNRDLTCRSKGNACRHRRCGEQTHLLLKTHARNKLGAIKTHCKHGHPMSGDNLRVDPRTGMRICKACKREEQRRFREQVRAGQRKPPPSWIATGYVDRTGQTPPSDSPG
jgi:hypothetical protein